MKRLLLDEMLSATIAQQLSGDLDVIAVSAHPAMRGMADADVLEQAALQGRIVVTDNVGDFAALNVQWAAMGKTHPGLLFISSKAYQQDRSRTGRIVAALRARCASRRWLSPGQYDFL